MPKSPVTLVVVTYGHLVPKGPHEALRLSIGRVLVAQVFHLHGASLWLIVLGEGFLQGEVLGEVCALERGSSG